MGGYLLCSILFRIASSGILLPTAMASANAATGVAGRVLDPQGKSVPCATIRLQIGSSETAHVLSNDQGQFHITGVLPGLYRLSVEAPGFQSGMEDVLVPTDGLQDLDVTLSGIAGQHQSVVISGKAVEPSVDLRNAEVFEVMALGLTASTILTIILEGLLHRPGVNDNNGYA